MSGTPYGLLGTPMLGQQQQPGAGLGSLYNAVNGQMQGPGGVWGGPTLNSAVAPPALQPLQTGLPGVQWYAAPGVTWNGPGGAPAPAPAPMPIYDQWGRPTAQQAAVPNMNAGPGLPVQPQQGSGYNQWGQQTPPSPQQLALAAAASQMAQQRQAPLTPADIMSAATGFQTQQQAMQNQDPATYGQPGDRGAWNRVQGLLGQAVGGGGSPGGGGGTGGGPGGPSQGNQGQQDAATAAGGQAASGDKGPSVGGGSAASGHDSDEEGPF